MVNTHRSHFKIDVISQEILNVHFVYFSVWCSLREEYQQMYKPTTIIRQWKPFSLDTLQEYYSADRNDY